MQPDPNWQGPIAFHELLFGTWLSYITLVTIWEKLLNTPLDEWKYALLTCLGASFFIINHYFFYAPFYLWIINSYSLIFAAFWYLLGMQHAKRALGWKFAALCLAVVNSTLYVGFELLARLAIDRGMHEVWVMAATFLGFGGLILWRRQASEN